MNKKSAMYMLSERSSLTDTEKVIAEMLDKNYYTDINETHGSLNMANAVLANFVRHSSSHSSPERISLKEQSIEITLKKLYQHGANFYNGNSLGLVSKGDYGNFISFLLDNHQKDHLINIATDSLSDRAEKLPLIHHAVNHNAYNILSVLLENGFDIDQVDIQGRSPLFLANNLAMVKYLLQNNASTIVQDKSEKYPISCTNLFNGLTEKAEAFALIKAKMKSGGIKQAVTGNMVFQALEKDVSKTMFKGLFSAAKMNVDENGEKGYPLLWAACARTKNSLAVTEFLLNEKNANPFFSYKNKSYLGHFVFKQSSNYRYGGEGDSYKKVMERINQKLQENPDYITGSFLKDNLNVFLSEKTNSSQSISTAALDLANLVVTENSFVDTSWLSPLSKCLLMDKPQKRDVVNSIGFIDKINNNFKSFSSEEKEKYNIFFNAFAEVCCGFTKEFNSKTLQEDFPILFKMLENGCFLTEEKSAELQKIVNGKQYNKSKVEIEFFAISEANMIKNINKGSQVGKSVKVL